MASVYSLEKLSCTNRLPEVSFIVYKDCATSVLKQSLSKASIYSKISTTF